MPKFLVNIPVDYIVGHLRYGYFEGIIEAKDEQNAREKIKQMMDNREHDFELLIDGYEVDSYGEVNIKDATVEEIDE